MWLALRVADLRFVGGQPATTQAAPSVAAGSLDPELDCVVHPDPANGGKPTPPADVVAAADPVEPTGVVSIRAVGLGDLVLPSGRLLVADLFAMGRSSLPDLPAVDLPGFTGRAPVCLHVARLEPTDERAAFLHVRLRGDPVVRWAVGTTGCGVDGETGGVGSPEAVQAVTGDAGIDRYLAAIEANNVNTWSWTNFVTDPSSGANVIGFSTGFGDGGYPVYAGMAADGRVVSVVADLLVVPWRWLGVIGPVPPA